MADEADRAQDHIEREMEQRLFAARMTTAAGGESAEYCECCGDEIPADRRTAVLGVRLFVDCATEHEQAQRLYGAGRCC